jgi:hypothetical protein
VLQPPGLTNFPACRRADYAVLARWVAETRRQSRRLGWTRQKEQGARTLENLREIGNLPARQGHIARHPPVHRVDIDLQRLRQF